MGNDTLNNEEIIATVKNKLFVTAHYMGNNVLKKSVEAIHSVLKCTECSLWEINHNSTQKDKEAENRDFISTSLIERKTSDSVTYSFKNDTDFVHDLYDGLFKDVTRPENAKPVYIYSRDKAFKHHHRSADFVREVGLNKLIVFPIPKEKRGPVIALLELSYQECPLDDSVWEELADILCPFVTAAFVRDTYVQKQSLMESMIRYNQKYSDSTISEFLDKILNEVLLKFCPAQGASFFVWDTYQNRYNLVATTGLNPQIKPLIVLGVPVDVHIEKETVYYQKGEGRTGYVGKTCKLLITDDIQEEEAKGDVKGKYGEILPAQAKTEMFIPVKDPLKKGGEGIGVFRLVNKKNVCNKKIVDYFDDADADMMKYAADYLALVIANYQKEENQYNLIDKLTHEITTPANAIWKTASRLYDHLRDEDFMLKNLAPYLKDIISFAELQKWQASTNLYLSRNRRKQPLHVRYNIRPTALHKVIEESIDIAIPIARKYHVKFDNIVIDPRANPLLLVNIDKNAFKIVFYNLLTNAIKYHDTKASGDDFYIGISYFIDGESLVIKVADNGFGIKPEEKGAIFETGFRGEMAIQNIASGSGVGLTVTRQIIKDFGGDIYIESLRKPTVFHIDLPKNIIL